MINCRIYVCTRRSVQNYGRVSCGLVCTPDTALLESAPRRDRRAYCSRAARRAGGRPERGRRETGESRSYIYLPHPTAPAQSRATAARAPGTPHNFSRPTRYSTGDRPHEHTPRPTPQWHCFCPTARCPHSLSLSAPPGHRALTETPARDVLEIWPRRRPGARARPLRPLVSRVASSVERPQAFFTTPTLAARRHRSCST